MQQLNLVSRTGASGLLGYSGSVVSADTPALSGLVNDGDRLTKWTLRLDSTLTSDLTMTPGRRSAARGGLVLLLVAAALGAHRLRRGTRSCA